MEQIKEIIPLTGEEVHDSKEAVPLLSELEISGSNILGDKAYGTAEIRDHVTDKNATYTIPPKVNAIDPWDLDWCLYKERHLGAVS